MNASEHTAPPSTPKEPSSPRPPALGKEEERFNNVSCFFPPNSNLKRMEDADEKRTTSKDASLHEAETEDYESYHQGNSSPPSPYKWAKSLQCLLEDSQGAALFQQFLNQEGHNSRVLAFWFACRGVKVSEAHVMDKVIRLVYERQVKRISESVISTNIKNEISQKLSSGVGVDSSIFDAAQQEVEHYMNKTTYPNFLKSDLYIRHLDSLQSENFSTDQELSLPTVHEEQELDAYSQHGNDNNRKRANPMKYRPESHNGQNLRSPYSFNYSAYHTKYSSYLPASAQDSEIQSISSGALTEDTMSQADSTFDSSMHRKQKRPSRPRYSGVLHRDKHTLNLSVIPRTQRPQPNNMIIFESPEQCALLAKKLLKVQQDQVMGDKLNENLKLLESHEANRGEDPAPKSSSTSGLLNPSTFLCSVEEDNQEILDKHVSRVFPLMGRTPTLSPMCPSPPVINAEEYRKSLEHSYVGACGASAQDTVPYRYRQEPDTHSNDSGHLTDWTAYDSESVDYSQPRPNLLRRCLARKTSSFTDSNSYIDSGVSMAGESVNPKPGSRSRNSSFRDWPHSQDPGMPILPPPDTTTNLLEAKRRLEDESRVKTNKPKLPLNNRMMGEFTRGKVSSRSCDSGDDGMSHRKQSRKSDISHDVTIIGYTYGRGTVPYKSKLPGRNITLRQFKSLLNKKGNFRYFFKRVSDDFGTGVVLEEILDDYEILPLWEGKVFGIIESMEDMVTPNED